MALFLVTGGVGSLVITRIVQGVATGAAIGAMGAYLLDLQPSNGSALVLSAAPSDRHARSAGCV